MYPSKAADIQPSHAWRALPIAVRRCPPPGRPLSRAPPRHDAAFHRREIEGGHPSRTIEPGMERALLEKDRALARPIVGRPSFETLSSGSPSPQAHRCLRPSVLTCCAWWTHPHPGGRPVPHPDHLGAPGNRPFYEPMENSPNAPEHGPAEGESVVIPRRHECDRPDRGMPRNGPSYPRAKENQLMATHVDATRSPSSGQPPGNLDETPQARVRSMSACIPPPPPSPHLHLNTQADPPGRASSSL